MTAAQIKVLFLGLLLTGFCLGQGPWLWTGSVHTELDWFTIKTEHYRVHYHNGIEEIAQKGASIAEAVYPVLLKQMGIESTPVIDVVFTAEDEIMNGYAMWTSQTFIWVDQNDAAIWLEDEKWLYQVLSHELQHIVFFHSIKSWIPNPFGFLFSGVPGWMVEGLAEYYTERWRPYRSELTHKTHVIKNSLDEMDIHHDGISKVLLLADKYGDSTIVNILQYRNKAGIPDFKKAFKKYTGQSVSQFNEEWRRTMNTSFYGYRAQKENFKDIGSVASLPISHTSGFRFAPDSLKLAMVGQDDNDQFDQSLFIAELEPVSDDNSSGLLEKLGLRNNSDNGENEDKPTKLRFEKEEQDYGSFHSALNWSPDGSQLVYAKSHRGDHGSILFDIKIMDTETGRSRWLTQNQRATYPIWSPDGQSIVFVAHRNSTSNLFSITPNGTNLTQLTKFEDDVQILTPMWSPDGQSIAFGLAASDGNTDITVLNLATSEMTRLTKNPEVDYLPVWHPDGSRITYTSHKGLTPNLHTVDLATGHSEQITDVGDAVWSAQWTPNGETIIASTLQDVDSVRIVYVDPDRKTTTAPLNLRDSYTSWKIKRPDDPLPALKDIKMVSASAPEKYRFYKYPKHMTSFILPLDVLFGMTAWTDALGKHVFQFVGGTTWDFETPFYLLSYTNAEHGPLWGINYYHNVNWTFRFYDDSDSGLWEVFNGGNIWCSIPMYSGEHMSSARSLNLGFGGHKREFEGLDDYEGDEFIDHEYDVLLPPEEGDEGKFFVQYTWVSRRPHRLNNSLPGNGFGLRFTGEFSDESVFGDFTYQKYTFDSFINIGLGKPAGFIRLKGLALDGDRIPNQEYLGISNDIAIYGPGSAGTFGLPENHNIRGYDKYRLGDRLVFGSAEFRYPLLDSFPVDILGISIGGISAVLFSDFGNSWSSDSQLSEFSSQLDSDNLDPLSDSISDDFITTAGYEARVALQIGGSPLFYIGIGEAKEIKEWDNNDTDPVQYVRFSLINPF